MATKTVTFDDSKERDKKLLHDIEKYQRQKGIRHRVDAVRRLCEIALKIEKITNREEEEK